MATFCFTSLTLIVINISSHTRIVAAGAVSQSVPADQPYGDRVAGVTDPFNNLWYIATHISDAPL